eukprot:TRINITY_DN6440_c0_g1_i1.p1 TRINITY_DN6440_c0_g1~~TRINITY_DN6440_c0_g1_i1.p1  ORF type:complete len:304 (-),score=78.08 TRINITY_DN6440_c0_g1_i1:57-968(-)
MGNGLQKRRKAVHYTQHGITLPNDVIREIFHHLDLVTLGRSQRVCKTWKSLITDRCWEERMKRCDLLQQGTESAKDSCARMGLAENNIRSKKCHAILLWQSFEGYRQNRITDISMNGNNVSFHVKMVNHGSYANYDTSLGFMEFDCHDQGFVINQQEDGLIITPNYCLRMDFDSWNKKEWTIIVFDKKSNLQLEKFTIEQNRKMISEQNSDHVIVYHVTSPGIQIFNLKTMEKVEHPSVGPSEFLFVSHGKGLSCDFQLENSMKLWNLKLGTIIWHQEYSQKIQAKKSHMQGQWVIFNLKTST